MPSAQNLAPINTSKYPEATATFDYSAITNDELSFEEGERFDILQADDPEWFLVRRRVPVDNEPLEGFAPRTFLKFDGGLLAKLANNGHNRASSDPLSPQSQTPSTLLSPFSPSKSLNSPNVRHVLAAFGTMPSGFRPSTLSEYYSHKRGKLSYVILPQFEHHGLGFEDMKINTADDTMSAMKTSCVMAFSIMDAKNVPLVGTGNTVFGRYVNIAIFDKSAVLGNVQPFPAYADVKNERSWRFSHKSSFLFPSDDENSCVVRINDPGPDICVLFELVVTVARKGEDSSVETRDISCGWGVLPVYGIDGKPLDARTYDIKLFGGTPFEKDVPLEDLAENTLSKSLWQSLRNVARTPQMHVKVWKLGSRVEQQTINLLPRTITCPLNAIKVLLQIRKILFRHMVSKRDVPDLKVVNNPFLNVALQVLDELDLLKSLSRIWEERYMTMKRSDKRHDEVVEKAFLETVSFFWPAIASVSMPKYKAGYQGRMDDRSLVLSQWLAEGPIKSFAQSSPTDIYTPFTVDECAYSHLQLISQ